MTTGSPPALDMRGITKSFGGTPALRDASISVRAGTVHALLGENGAGKTTLMRIAFGLISADAGTVERQGRLARYRSTVEASRDGIGMVHQHFTLVPAMTVAENVSLGGRGAHTVTRAIERVREIGDATGLVVNPLARVSELSVSAQQRVEIIKAFAHGATLLILDEPTAVLAPRDASDLLVHLRAFANAGNAVVFITHKLREALTIADEVTVLRKGTTVRTARVGDIVEDALVDAMVGDTLVDRPRTPVPPLPEVVLRLERVSLSDDRGTARLQDVSMAVRAGEVVGVAGVEGNGQRELLRLLAGRLRPSSGHVACPPAVGFVPEDRHRDAVIEEFTLAENTALLGAGQRTGVIAWDLVTESTQRIISEFDVQVSGPGARMRTLSGGNQQRFVMGRELHDAPRALVLESPSRGLDVRATAAVHDRIRRVRDHGTAVVVYTSDMDELLALSDRVVVCYAGSVRQVQANSIAIGRAMVGADT